MNYSITFSAFILALFPMLVFFSSCDKNNDNPKPKTTGTIVLDLDHTVDGYGVVYNDLRYSNASGDRYSIMTLKYYISDIKFHKYSGEPVLIDTVFYRDINDPNTRSLVIKNVPDGEYTFISFIFGLPPSKNITNGLPPTLENNNMEWPVPMGGGYHYMKLEGRYERSDGELGNYKTHTGRLKTMDGVLHENYVEVELPYSSFTVDQNNWEFQVIMNINEWYCTPHLYSIKQFGPAIMDNQAAQQSLKENGKNAFSLGYIIKDL